MIIRKCIVMNINVVKRDVNHRFKQNDVCISNVLVAAKLDFLRTDRNTKSMQSTHVKSFKHTISRT